MIDWENRQITGKSGKVYRIEPEKITAGRYPEFEIQSLLLHFGNDFRTFYTLVTNSRVALTSGNDLLNAHTQAVHNLDEIIAGIGNYVEAKTPKLIKFLTLFCNAEGENLERWDEQIGLSKYEDWSHIPMSDFFLLLSEVLPSLKESLKIRESQKKD